ncbi:hypothetical protein CVD25_18560 [Bacillus canaveralius]|uniref:Uncharacterized protein n=1 Tax=Bacillus canaveralius TaxID=1403243 RepID=A0A2N5GI13_9BACI|nr:hypothetical protein CU635_17805 [Bacillus canaveralius]PLR92502.1 hypothetical protein CVD25_18560 [Bacillus canaveralius]
MKNSCHFQAFFYVNKRGRLTSKSHLSPKTERSLLVIGDKNATVMLFRILLSKILPDMKL